MSLTEGGKKSGQKLAFRRGFLVPADAPAHKAPAMRVADLRGLWLEPGSSGLARMPRRDEPVACCTALGP